MTSPHSAPSNGPILAVSSWPTNAHMIRDVARLGYLHEDWRTLDPTFGNGTWWKLWQPDYLVACDIDPDRSPLGRSIDVTRLPMRDGYFDAVAFDPPYKLNGTPTADVDGRYGVHVYRSREDRHRLILDGVTECARVLAVGGFLIVKCQNQVNGGKVRWQTDIVTAHAAGLRLDKVDELHMLGYRPQPEGRRQEHARRNHSTLLIFQRQR